jgi:hypothetical protein
MPAHFARITLRSMLLAVFWLCVCLACWTSLSQGRDYRLDIGKLLLGWFALWTAIAALFGVALTFVRTTLIMLPLAAGVIALLFGMTLVMPRVAAIGIVLLLVWGTSYKQRAARGAAPAARHGPDVP